MANRLTLGARATMPCCWPIVIPCIETLTCNALTISMAQLIQLRSQIRMASNVWILAMTGCVTGKRSIAPGQLDNDQLPSSVRQRMALLATTIALAREGAGGAQMLAKLYKSLYRNTDMHGAPHEVDVRSLACHPTALWMSHDCPITDL